MTRPMFKVELVEGGIDILALIGPMSHQKMWTKCVFKVDSLRYPQLCLCLLLLLGLGLSGLFAISKNVVQNFGGDEGLVTKTKFSHFD